MEDVREGGVSSTFETGVFRRDRTEVSGGIVSRASRRLPFPSADANDETFLLQHAEVIARLIASGTVA